MELLSTKRHQCKSLLLSLLLLMALLLPAGAWAVTPQFTSNGSSMFALLSDGTVIARGTNAWGELGDGTTSPRNSFAPIAGLTGVTSIVAGLDTIFALKADGTVMAWGTNINGILGDGTTVSQYVPTLIPALTGVTSIVTSTRHSLALTGDGRVLAWGYNGTGQLGDGTTENHYIPALVPGLSGVIALGIGVNSSFAIRADGSVWAWGENGYGQLGDGTTESRTIPVKTKFNGVVAITGGDYHTIAVMTDGSLFASGHARYLGNGTPFDYSITSPQPISDLSGVSAISAGRYHTLALKVDGTVYAWGGNSSNQLGDSTSIHRNTPVKVSNLFDIVSVTAASSNSFAVKSDGSVVTWGWRNYGALSPDEAFGNTTPLPVLNLSNVSAIAAGWSNSSAITNDGNVALWGAFVAWQIGDGSEGDVQPYPTNVVNQEGVVAIAQGNVDTLLLKRDGSVVSLSNPNCTASQLSGIKSIAAGMYHNVALTNNGTVVTWGSSSSSNSFGQLGDGTTHDNSVPRVVSGLGNVIAIAAGSYSTYAIKDNGTVYAWGRNDGGQLGDGTAINRLLPTPIPALSNAVAIVGNEYSGPIALRSNGTLFQVSGVSGTNIINNAPTNCKALHGGSMGHSLALMNDGTVMEFTDGDLMSGSLVDGLNGVIGVAAGANHSLALLDNGTVVAWGSDYYGQLGDGMSTETLMAPAVVPDVNMVELMINGVCGANSGSTLVNQPTTNLCSSGTASTVTVSIPWQWNCSGTNGGSSSTCTANKLLLSQTIVFGAVPTITYGGSGSVTATASSGMSVTFSSLTPSICTVNGATVTGINTGSCSIAANQSGNSTYAAAPQATLSFTVLKATPAITWPTASSITYGQTLASSTLSGGSSTPAGSFVFTTPTTAPNAGTAAQGVTFTPTDSSNYLAVAGLVNVTVTNATPVVTWNTPSAITYGTTLSATQLNATATVSGSLVYSPASGTVLTAGSQILNVIFTPTDSNNYNSTTTSVPLTVNKATPVVTTWPTASTITYGQTLASSTLAGGNSTPAGGFAFTTPNAVPNAGTAAQGITFTPTNSSNYFSVTGSVNVTVTKATPVITWSNPATITYGTALSPTQLNATASVQGTLTYTPAAGTILNVGTQTLNVSFTPSDSTNYTATSKSATLAVIKATPVVTWPNSSAITYGQTLANSTLSGGSSTAAGSFAFTTPSMAPNAGTAAQGVTFTPTNSSNYLSVAGTVNVTVNKATPVITWSTPAAITYGTPLTTTQLNATATIPGSLSYSPAAGTILSAGNQTLSATFSPIDTANYNSVVKTVTLTVIGPTPPVTTASPAGGEYTSGQTVTLTANKTATIYYTTNGSTPSTSSTVYSTPLTISSTTTLKYFARDAAGNSEDVRTQVYTFDTTAPVTTATPAGGTYASTQTVTLSANETGTIYYTTDSAMPTTSSMVYTAPLTIAATTTLKYFARDLAGNNEAVKTQVYTIDGVPPVTTASPAGGTYASFQTVTLSANKTATIYYTTNGSTPTTSSTVYSAPLTIVSTTTLKYFARDAAGNNEGVKTQVYTIDTTTPVTTVTPAGGTYTSTQTVTLSANETATIYYTTNGSTPNTSSPVYTAPLTIDATCVLKYFARDLVGNNETVKRQVYVIRTNDNGSNYSETFDSLSVIPSGWNVEGAASLNSTSLSPGNSLLVGNGVYTDGAVSFVAPVPGSFVYDPATGTVLTAGNQSISVTFTPTDGSNYNTASKTVTLTVSKATPVITWPTASSITYGQTLANSTLSGGTSTPAGSFAFTTPTTAPNAGTVAQGVTFIPTDSSNYTSVTGTVNVTVNKATPTITWSTPAAITYGTVLSATQLNATASVSGTFAYSPASGTVLTAGSQTLTVTFTPTDSSNYSTATTSVPLTVNRAAPSVTWPTASAITYGQTLASSTLSGGSSTPAGSFVFTTPTTAPNAGTAAQGVTFTPTDTTNYTSATGMVNVIVNKATPIITWNDPTAIIYGTSLSVTQLNATASVPGTFIYNPASGTVLTAGSQKLSVIFNPTDSTNYNSTSKTGVNLVVNKATGTVTLSNLSQTYDGTAKPVTASTMPTGKTVAITYNGSATAPTIAGSYAIVATITDSNYLGSATGTLVIAKATATITWNTPTAISFGTPLSATQLNATASVPGSFNYSPAAGMVLNAGDQHLTAIFTPLDLNNYNSTIKGIKLTVNKAIPIITWSAPAPITYGTPLSAMQLNATASVPGTFSYSPAAGAILTAGSQSLNVAFTPTDSTNYNGTTKTVNLTVNNAAAAVTQRIAAGGYHTAALKKNGTVVAWGYNSAGQLGDGTTTNRSTPTPLPGLSSVVGISAGNLHTVALKNDGTVVAWGYNTYGQLGDGTTTNRSNPTPVPGLSGVVAITAGDFHTVALKSDGTVVAWGDNGLGQLGDGTTTGRSTPTPVPGLNGVVAVSAGAQHTVALKSDGTVVAWGYNTYGQLGDGTTTGHFKPTSVPGLSGVVAISAGMRYTVALKNDGTVEAWGDNYYGQLGDGTTIRRLVSTPVPGLNGVLAISAGAFHTVALKSDGTVAAWGYNSTGQLGDGTTTRRLISTPVSGLNGVVAISAGDYHTVAQKSDGTVMTWGENTYGQLGDGTKTNRLTPTPVPGLSDVGI